MTNIYLVFLNSFHLTALWISDDTLDDQNNHYNQVSFSEMKKKVLK